MSCVIIKYMKIYLKNKKKHLFIAFYALGKSYRMFIANRPITFGAGLSCFPSLLNCLFVTNMAGTDNFLPS